MGLSSPSPIALFSALPFDRRGVARLPNLSGKGKALLIAGTETEATEAGGDFLMSETSLAQIQRVLGARAGEPFPDFEALLGTSRMGGASPTARLIAVRRH